MVDNYRNWNVTETGGATVTPLAASMMVKLAIPAHKDGYSNAQIDDYGGERSAGMRWGSPVSLTLQARFSGTADSMVGTAGFGFWNAPFGPGTGYRLRLPQACWFFFASASSNLPLAPGDAPGNGWFASTIDASTKRAQALIPFLAPVLLLNQLPAMRRMLWPIIRRYLGISFERVDIEMQAWHEYGIVWRDSGTSFLVDGRPLINSAASARGPLGFVAWMDNQHMTVTSRGRVGWGVEEVKARQWLEIGDIALTGTFEGSMLPAARLSEMLKSGRAGPTFESLT